MSNTKDTPIDYTPMVLVPEKIIQEYESLKSELQKQKELNAELVKEIESYRTANGTGFWTDKIESLIKKSDSQLSEQEKKI